jgi:hypothetical protein
MEPTKAIPYWIQRADCSATDYEPIPVADAIRAFEGHDWRSELDLFSEMETTGADCCPPGIGFVASDGTILHICPGSDGRAMVHYHFSETRKLVGLIPRSRSIVETSQDISFDRLDFPSAEEATEAFRNVCHDGSKLYEISSTSLRHLLIFEKTHRRY